MDMSDKYLQEIKTIVSNRLNMPKTQVFIFGSRANKNAREFSDVDIGFISTEKIPLFTISLLREDFENSNIPFSVDLVDFTKVSEDFKNQAFKNTISLN